jgi:minor extracellular serine protease Vpr
MDAPGDLNAAALPLPRSLGGVSVTMNGIPAPVLSVNNRNGQEQINVHVPFELEAQSSAQVAVTRGDRTPAAVTVPVLDLQPAVYTADGTTAIVVHNADYSLVTPQRPLVPGEYAFLYATGLGRVANRPPNGAAAPATTALADVRVTVGGLSCEVQYAGLAPGFAGVYQVNFRVPASAASGSQDVVLAAGPSTAPAVRAPIR